MPHAATSCFKLQAHLTESSDLFEHAAEALTESMAESI